MIAAAATAFSKIEREIRWVGLTLSVISISPTLFTPLKRLVASRRVAGLSHAFGVFYDTVSCRSHTKVTDFLPPPPICVLVTSRHFVGVLETHGPKHIPQQGTGTDTGNIEMLAYDVTAATMSARNIFRNSEN